MKAAPYKDKPHLLKALSLLLPEQYLPLSDNPDLTDGYLLAQALAHHFPLQKTFLEVRPADKTLPKSKNWQILDRAASKYGLRFDSEKLVKGRFHDLCSAVWCVSQMVENKNKALPSARSTLQPAPSKAMPVAMSNSGSLPHHKLSDQHKSVRKDEKRSEERILPWKPQGSAKLNAGSLKKLSHEKKKESKLLTSVSKVDSKSPLSHDKQNLNCDQVKPMIEIEVVNDILTSKLSPEEKINALLLKLGHRKVLTDSTEMEVEQLRVESLMFSPDDMKESHLKSEVNWLKPSSLQQDYIVGRVYVQVFHVRVGTAARRSNETALDQPLILCTPTRL